MTDKYQSKPQMVASSEDFLLYMDRKFCTLVHTDMG